MPLLVRMQLSSIVPYLQFLLVICILFEREKRESRREGERERKREKRGQREDRREHTRASIHMVVHSTNACNKQGWARLKPGV